MKRKRIIVATVVLVLSVFMFWTDWRKIAYVKEPGGYLELHEKRWQWLPVPRHWSPDQVCPSCQGGAGVSDSVDEWGVAHKVHHHLHGDGRLDIMQPFRGNIDFGDTRRNPRCICQKCFPGRKAR